MTFHDLFERLCTIDQAAYSLLLEIGFLSDDGLGDSVCPLTDTAQDAFLRNKAEELLESLELLHQELDYLKKPIHGEYRLEQFPYGRWGYFDKQGLMHTFSCGQTIEAKIHDRFGTPRWIRTRFEHDGGEYFLLGGQGVSLEGLTVRERGGIV